MPIYEYRCESCGFQKEFLQKLSDPPHSTCPECHGEAFKKLLSAGGFQLKGSGWYATDFKGGGSGQPSAAKTDSAPPCQGGTGACACAGS
jgi:putative FmdB family regulatory protein